MTKLLRVKAVADLLGVSPKKVLQLTRDGRLKSILLGPRTIRFHQDDVEELVSEWTTKRRF